MLPHVFEGLLDKFGPCEIIDKPENAPRNFDPSQKLRMGVCVILKDAKSNLVLVQQAMNPGYWFFVCGKNEGCEALEETAVREVHEEIGCSIRVTGLHHIGHHYCMVQGIKHSLYYGAALYAEILSGTPKVNSEEISHVDSFKRLPENFLPGHKKYYQKIL